MENTLQRLARVEESSKQAHKRISTMESEMQAINELAVAAATMANELSGVKRVVDRLDQRLACIEHKPAKRWEAVIAQIIQILVAAAVGYLLITK